MEKFDKEALLDKKIFSLNDLFDMGLMKREEFEAYLRYLEARALVAELFKGLI
jgi:hypothetical protein